MPKVKSIDELSATELFKLAEKRKKEEEEKKIAANKAKIEELKSQRKALVAAHRKELSAIDRQLKKLTGITPISKTSNKNESSGTTDSILSMLSSAKSMTTAEIRTELENNGQSTNNLSQTLAYLKRTNRVKSPARSTYALA